MSQNNRRVVITGMGVISPLGNSPQSLWDSLIDGASGVDYLERVPGEHLPSKFGGEARQFTGSIDDFGELEKSLKRNIKKGLKLMCREIEMGVASAQHAIAEAAFNDTYEPTRIGTIFGCDYIITEPGEFAAGIQQCGNNGAFDFERWGENGLNKVEPLWLLKYLPNMPASHVAIYNDFRGPSNSITLREASSNLAVAEATTIIRRGIADCMVVGATGSRIHPLKSVHVALQEALASGDVDGNPGPPSQASRPFARNRDGMVIAEGAGAIVLEDYDRAQQRGAKIYAEIIGYGSSTVANRQCVADYQQAFSNVLKSSLESAEISPEQIGHVNAHGLSSVRCDLEEAKAIADCVGKSTPVVACKGSMGNLGAGSGMVELVASVLALQKKQLFPTLNSSQMDPECEINLVQNNDTKPGNSVVNLNITAQGQASAVIAREISQNP